MSDNIFNQDWFRLFNHTSMDEFLKMSQRFKKFGLTPKDVEDAIKSACDFFHIPMPRMIQDLTNVQNGQTMFVNWHPGLYEDDVLCYNMQQLVDMKRVRSSCFAEYTVSGNQQRHMGA